jgi:hypothetical protein
MMDAKRAVETIKGKFKEQSEPILISLQNEGFFTAQLVEGGVEVDNLLTQPFLAWEVFIETIKLLSIKGGRAERGEALKYKLGEEGLSMDSIEGRIAFAFYGKKLGEKVLPRISPIAGILIWAGICESAPGELVLREV